MTLRKKKEQMHRRIKRIGLTLLLVLVFGIGGLLFAGNHASAGEIEKTAYYTPVTVQAGDSLWSIAKTYAPEYADLAAYVDTLKEINHIKSASSLKSGQTLIVVYYQ